MSHGIRVEDIAWQAYQAGIWAADGVGRKVNAAMLMTDGGMTRVNEVPCRVWQGQSDLGVPCHAHIALIGVDRNDDAEEFERELRVVNTPRADIQTLPLRMLVD